MRTRGRGGHRRGGRSRGGVGGGQGYHREGREDGQRWERSEARKVRNVEGDPDFWVRNGVMGEEGIRKEVGGERRGARGRNCDITGEEREQTGGRDVRRSQEPQRGNGREPIADQFGGDVDLRARLSEQLTRGLTECMVCLERVRQVQATWDCHNCYQVFHIGCIRKWAKTATTESGGWRCPGCQAVTATLPRDYRCFCRKVRNPEWNRNEGLVPHSCGEVCQRPRAWVGCVHRCVELCHAGPCPPCTATVEVECPCGKERRRGRCGEQVRCGQECGRELGCGVHSCEAACHEGECGQCEEVIQIGCYCGENKKTVPCSKTASPSYSCSSPCPRLLACGQHPCTSSCHPGECQPCSLTVESVTHCPCGKYQLDLLYSRDSVPPRDSCLAPVPLCGLTCGKSLPCGPPSSPHTCPTPCHSGPCPPCPLSTSVRCRCGHMDQEMVCTLLTTRADDARCGKRCQKKRSCGRHKCGELCCIQVEHICTLLCGRLLSCNLHRCEELCHRGNCHSCPMVSFDELSCHCGSAVTFPPVACGTRPPECVELCRKEHQCGHQVTHNCHSEATCPPCTQLTTKLCYGGHEQRRNVACLVEGISCGKPCGADLPCGRHPCPRPCHPGPCTANTCTQPCSVYRPCGHPCSTPCHPGQCPDTPCATQIKISCSCGHRQAGVPCSENAYSRVTTALLATRMQDVQSGNSVNLAELAKRDRKLECNEDCMKIDRNYRLAAALQISNPELTSKVIPRYSEFMKDWVRRDVTFCTMVHTKLADLIKLAKDSKQKSRAFSFPCMNRDKRQLVHEYADHFGCESESYDSEPKRNVVVTALRDRSHLPSVSLVECVAKQKKAPPPVQASSTAAPKPTFTPLERGGSEPKIDWFG